MKQPFKIIKYTPAWKQAYGDKYLDDTSLRLRHVEGEHGGKYKLTKKENLVPEKKGVCKITTIYLSIVEFELLGELKGVVIEKTRHVFVIGNNNVGVDVIEGGEGALYLAEVEFEAESEMNAFEIPVGYVKEVTGEQRYNGYELAEKYGRREAP